MSATADRNSCRQNSGAYGSGWVRSPLNRPALTDVFSLASVEQYTAACRFPVAMAWAPVKVAASMIVLTRSTVAA